MECQRKWASFGGNALLQRFGSSPLNNYRILIKQQFIFKEDGVTSPEGRKSLQCAGHWPFFTRHSSILDSSSENRRKTNRHWDHSNSSWTTGWICASSSCPIHKKKSKIQSVQLVRDEDEVEPSQQQEEEGPKIITQSLSLSELWDMQEDFSCQSNELLVI